MSTTLHPGERVLLTATPKGASLSPTNPTISWASDNTAVITVTDNGNGTAYATGIVPGTAGVLATAHDPDGHTIESAPYELIVDPPDTDSVSVTAGVPEPAPATGSVTPPASGSTTPPTAGGSTAPVTTPTTP